MPHKVFEPQRRLPRILRLGQTSRPSKPSTPRIPLLIKTLETSLLARDNSEPIHLPCHMTPCDVQRFIEKRTEGPRDARRKPSCLQPKKERRFSHLDTRCTQPHARPIHSPPENFGFLTINQVSASEPQGRPSSHVDTHLNLEDSDVFERLMAGTKTKPSPIFSSALHIPSQQYGSFDQRSAEMPGRLPIQSRPTPTPVPAHPTLTQRHQGADGPGQMFSTVVVSWRLCTSHPALTRSSLTQLLSQLAEVRNVTMASARRALVVFEDISIACSLVEQRLIKLSNITFATSFLHDFMNQKIAFSKKEGRWLPGNYAI